MQYQKAGRKRLPEKINCLDKFLGWNFNNQSDFLLLPTTFLLDTKMSYEISARFSDDVISNFLFQRQFYQPDSQQQLPQQQHETLPLTTTSARKQMKEFSSSPNNDNTNKEEENSFVAISLLMLQQTQNNLIGKKTNNRYPEDRVDIELFIDLVHQFPVIWNTCLNGFLDYNKRVPWNNISSSLDNKYPGESIFFPCRIPYSLS